MTEREELTEIREILMGIRAAQAVHTEQLREHMRRTELAETGLSDIRKDIKPIQTHVARVDGVLKFLGALATAGAVLAGLWTAWKGH